MTEREREARLSENDWLELIRRSFGLPDVIGDGMALEVIVDRVVSLVPPRLTEEAKGDVASWAVEIIGAVAKAGAAEKLDGFLMDRPLPLGADHETSYVEKTADVCISEMDASRLRRAIAVQVLEPLKSFVRFTKSEELGPYIPRAYRGTLRNGANGRGRICTLTCINKTPADACKPRF